ncbi:MAG: Fur family transcriptional regulator [Candidatus Cloacimonetes bacterium]|jgi:Fur family ferric uptake transcriptional regulator|nr:transcriptional repressor [Candidatus Cloacimonadota bacterium]MDY0298353.1 Fur family transcriptional regulator [Candidatus Cloacimonadaceae bacterium]MCB5278036.1 transcriptional repressor [Candidatus Cloacimonadota bacterium]MCK9331628.1 transcriptional repressor [Candidatus Cloacimonadota bacterium]MDD2209907.1 Fur family transcriptional regulator [Candidatus Cloacimonadota bacterium]
MQEHQIQFRRYLENHGLKLTRSRSLILEAVYQLHEHFDAEALHDVIRSTNVSLATVYRTLPLLVEAGLIQTAVRCEGREYFEHILGHPKHVHWVCDKCKNVIETDLAELMPTIEKRANELKFTTDQINISISGLCWKCQVNANDSQ